jgi:uncharacterized protein
MAHPADDDVVRNRSSNPHLDDVIRERLADVSRREVLRGGLGVAALSFLAGPLLSACADDETLPPPPSGGRPSALGFTAVAKSLADQVTVAAGYTATVLYRLGDPIAAAVSAYANDGTDAADTFDRRAGDHHDGMYFFGLSAGGAHSPDASDRGLLVMNHEAITPLFLHPNGQTVVSGARTVAEEILREFYVHGVSIIEVNRTGGAWSYKQDSSLNRRIHTLTEMILSGPVGGHALTKTKFSPDGTRTRGTVNNCANGHTPWGTYLTCEENWAGYFRRIVASDDPNRTATEISSFGRYGVAGTGRELWATFTPDTADGLYGRWNAMKLGASADGTDDYRNVANTFGWVVEIDPFNPTSTPKKRTAMGRLAHEGAWPAKAVAGKPLVFYMGDDSRGEYIYKFVSTESWNAGDTSGGLAAGDKYLDSGKLYAAKFNADGTGTWLELSFGVNGITAANPAYAFADQADVLTNARLAADAAGATKMDRPEWAAVDPINGNVYVTLTNNNATVRSLASTEPANPRHYNDQRTSGANQFGNANGHIIRFAESSPEALAFTWDIFLFGARSTADASNVNVSGLTAENDFSSPDGCWFSNRGVCWIETDDGAFTDVTNCMLLAALPGQVGDGTTKTIHNTDQGGATKDVSTRVAAPIGNKLRRFLVGPIDCELTGLAETPDGQTLFVQIQHPGETTAAANIGSPLSSWPGGGTSRPRSATLAITRTGGGVIGL